MLSDGSQENPLYGKLPTIFCDLLTSLVCAIGEVACEYFVTSWNDQERSVLPGSETQYLTRMNQMSFASVSFYAKSLPKARLILITSRCGIKSVDDFSLIIHISKYASVHVPSNH